MDRKRAYFFRLLFMFYTNFAIKTTDFNLYPYISTQLVNILAGAIAKHIADQPGEYFKSDEDNR